MEYHDLPDILELSDRYEVIKRYKEISDFDELRNIVQKDLDRLRANLTGNADKIYDMENLVSNFSWWMFYSYGITVPGTLADDYMGRSFMPYFEEIKQNLIQKANAPKADI